MGFWKKLFGWNADKHLEVREDTKTHNAAVYRESDNSSVDMPDPQCWQCENNRTPESSDYGRHIYDGGCPLHPEYHKHSEE